MATTTVSFDEFLEALSDAYAMEVGNIITLPVFEEEMDEDLGDVVVLYDEWNGSIKIPYSRNPVIEFDKVGRTYQVKGFAENEMLIDTFSIRFLKLA
jgi:hypothetical protein